MLRTSNQKGSVLILVLVVIAVLGVVLNFLGKSLTHQNEVQQGRSLAEKSITIIKGWEELMNYHCQKGTVPVSLTLRDLPIPKRNESLMYKDMTFEYYSIPDNKIVINVTSNTKSLNAMNNRLKKLFTENKILASLRVTRTSNTLTVEATRTGTTSQTIHDTFRNNSDAIGTTIHFFGSDIYDGNGC